MNQDRTHRVFLSAILEHLREVKFLKVGASESPAVGRGLKVPSQAMGSLSAAVALGSIQALQEVVPVGCVMITDSADP